MIKQQIQGQLKDAMRAKDHVTLDTLRYILSEMKYKEIEKQHELSDEESIEVIGKEVKKRRDAISLFKNSGRDELVKEEEAKLQVILTFLPEQMSEDEIKTIVDTVIAKTGTENMGMVMREVMSQVKGKADGKVVSQFVSKAFGK